MPDTEEQPCRLSRTMDLGFEHLDPDLRQWCAIRFAHSALRWTLVFSDVESSHLWRFELAQAGLQYIRTLAWRRLGGAPQFTGDRPASGFETMTLCHPPGRKRWNGGGKAGVYEHAIVCNNTADRGARVHTTQKPLPLMLDLVADFTDPGDVILDPFAGSGTTGVACVRLGRRCILIEQKPEYAATSIERLRAEESSSTLSAYRAGQTALFG